MSYQKALRQLRYGASFSMLWATGSVIAQVEVPQATADSSVAVQDSAATLASVTPPAETAPSLDSSAPQAIGEEPASQGGGSRLVQEVIVTAQKREENLRDVPISITAFNADQLDARGVTDANALPKITPGLTVSQQAGFTSTFLRGVGSDAFILGDPSVVTYIDGVYFPVAEGAIQDFGTIDHIEILKGPQGTLFGRNALGGAIKIDTRAPNLDRPEISAQSSYSTYDTWKTRVYASTPIVDGLAISGAAVYNASNNYVHGTIDAESNPRPLPGDRSEGYRGKLLYKPNDWFNARVSYFDINIHGSIYAVNTDPSTAGSAIQAENPRYGANTENQYQITHVRTFFGDARFKTDLLDIKLAGSQQLEKNSVNYDFDGSALPIANFSADPSFAHVDTAELQLLSNDTSPGADFLQYLFGAYYFRSRAGFQPAHLNATDTNLAEGVIGGIQVPAGLSNTLISVLTSAGEPLPTGANIAFTGVLDTESIAYFTQGTVNLTDHFAITFGARFQDEDRIIETSTAALQNTDGTTTLIQSYSGEDNPAYRSTTKSLDPKVSLNFKPDWGFLGDSPLLYASFQTASTSSTFNVINIYTPPEEVDGSTIYAYEAGIKTRLFHNLVDFSGSVFHYHIEEPQVQLVSLLAGGAVRFENAGGERIQGADFDTLIQLFPKLTDGGLILTLSACYLDSRYTSYTDGSGFQQGTGVLTQGNDYTGNPVVRAPRFTGTVGLSETLDTAIGPIEFGASYYHSNHYFYLAQSTPNVEQLPYGTLDVNLSYLYKPYKLRVSAFGTNVLNANYLASRFRTDFGSNDVPAPLAIYGVRLNYDF